MFVYKENLFGSLAVEQLLPSLKSSLWSLDEQFGPLD